MFAGVGRDADFADMCKFLAGDCGCFANSAGVFFSFFRLCCGSGFPGWVLAVCRSVGSVGCGNLSKYSQGDDPNHIGEDPSQSQLTQGEIPECNVIALPRDSVITAQWYGRSTQNNF